MSLYKEAVFPVLSRFDAEKIHDGTLQLLTLAEKYSFLRRFLEKIYGFEDTRLEVKAFGLDFKNPIGLAAGFDKNGVAPLALAALGFGHIEIGTVTPLPQEGNPRPRIFRLPEDGALINRMGFPGRGMRAARENLLYSSRERRVVLGVNAGANKNSVDEGRANEDYVKVVRELSPYADYLVINVSSPNTARLRDLQGKDALKVLVGDVRAVMEDEHITKPLLVKIAPDFKDYSEINDILDVATQYRVDGLIVTNTTLSREGLTSNLRGETGGLSGAPVLRSKSTKIIEYIYNRTEGELPIIGVGGIFNAEDVVEKMEAGASLVQVYTGLVYEGPGIVKSIKRDLVAFTEREGISDINVIVGAGN